MKKLNILLIDYNEGDILLTKDSFEESKLAYDIQVLKDGEAAIHFFEALKDDDVYPDTILLEINMPKVSGFEVLHFLKTNKKFKQIPVIMLTTSSFQKDIVRCYQYPINGYIVKPINVNDFILAQTTSAGIWTNIAT